MQSGWILLGVVVIGGIAILSWMWQSSRVDNLVNQWASQNGYYLLSYSRVWFSLDPFAMFAGKNRPVYNISVQDRNGNTRNGLLRVGGYWLGLWSDTCEVKWMD